MHKKRTREICCHIGVAKLIKYLQIHETLNLLTKTVTETDACATTADFAQGKKGTITVLQSDDNK